MVNRTYPEEGEIWEHPSSRNTYRIHSRTADGWTRYYNCHPSLQAHDCYPLWTQPTDKFMAVYRRKVQDG